MISSPAVRSRWLARDAAAVTTSRAAPACPLGIVALAHGSARRRAGSGGAKRIGRDPSSVGSPARDHGHGPTGGCVARPVHRPLHRQRVRSVPAVASDCPPSSRARRGSCPWLQNHWPRSIFEGPDRRTPVRVATLRGFRGGHVRGFGPTAEVDLCAWYESLPGGTGPCPWSLGGVCRPGTVALDLRARVRGLPGRPHGAGPWSSRHADLTDVARSTLVSPVQETASATRTADACSHRHSPSRETLAFSARPPASTSAPPGRAEPGSPAIEPGRSREVRRYSLSQTDFVWVYCSSAAAPSSRPKPDCLYPPNGIAAS